MSAQEIQNDAIQVGEDVKKDAKNRGWRSLGQAALVTVIVGAATGVNQLVQDDSVLTLATIATAAGSGALVALTAWIQRRLGK